ncbi:glycosyltransferase family 9 protein [Deferrisoma camini]|uniref:glycosyltransferase family 9 protein n=1 Tax=Deferrisoma camini TaxID=1035120 RepID=UPI00046D243F|nr:glycosyltransferase family 9 protein [Deferrisoma camini]
MNGLLYHNGGLGDFVLSMPAVLRLAAAYPGVAWSFWGPSDRRELLPGFGPPPADLVRRGHELWGEAPGPEAVGALAAFSVVAAFGGSRPPAWVGHAPGQVVSVRSFPPAGGPWVPAFQTDQLDRAGVPRPPGPLLPEWRARVLPRRSARWILLHPGSGDPKKNFPPEFWGEVAGRVSQSLGLGVRVALGPAEVERGSGGWEALGPATACSGLRDLIGLLAGAALFLGNDGGPAHLAGALGVPTVVVFGPTDPALWRPLGPRVRWIRTREPCAPCTAGGPIRCADPRCLGGVDVAEVVAVATSLVAEAPGQGQGQTGPGR